MANYKEVYPFPGGVDGVEWRDDEPEPPGAEHPDDPVTDRELWLRWRAGWTLTDEQQKRAIRYDKTVE